MNVKGRLKKFLNHFVVRIAIIVAALVIVMWSFYSPDLYDYKVESIQPATVMSILNTQSKYSSGFVSISAKLSDGSLVLIKLPRYKTRNVDDSIFVEVSVNAKGKKRYKLSDNEN